MRFQLKKRRWTVLLCMILTGGFIMTALNFIIGKKIDVKTDIYLDGVSHELSEILYYASLAPNSHNTQMWKVTLNPDKQKIAICLDEKRVLDQVDHGSREAYISIGAYVQNLLSAFEAYGYSTGLEIKDPGSEELVQVTYEKIANGSMRDTMIGKMTARHSDKRPFSEEEIDEAHVNALLNSTSGLYYFGRKSESFAYLKEAAMAAYEVQSSHQNARDELARWLRFSDEEALQKKDGLPAEQLGFSGIKKVFYYLFVNRKSAREDGFAKQGNETAGKQLEHCAGFFVLTGLNSRKDLIETGMELEKFWLNAVPYNIEVHPVSQALEEEPYKHEIQKKLGVDKPVQMVLRVGYVKDYGQNGQIRRDLNQYITVER